MIKVMQKGFANIIYLIIGVLVLILIGGAFYAGKVSNKSQSQSPVPVLTQSSPSPEATSANRIINQTADWRIFNSDGLKWAGEIHYSFRYPTSWVVKGSVFYDETDWKVAEILGGSKLLKQGEICLDLYNEDMEETTKTYGGYPGEILSQEKIKVGDFDGLLTRKKTGFEGVRNNSSNIYPFSYCLSQNGKAFEIQFYLYEDEYLNKSDKDKLFNSIISTFKFL